MDLCNAIRSDPGHSGVFLDFDGTLAPVVPDPEAAAIVDGAREVLEMLAGRYLITAMISGRAAADLRSRVGAAGPRYFGLYGSEEMTGRGLVQSPLAGLWREAAARLAQGAAQLISSERLAGCEVELKDLAVSLHYRKTGLPEPPERLLEWARSAAGEVGFGASIGRKVIELRPAGVSKADTLERLVRETGVTSALVAGDDAADVGMMRRAAQLLPGAVVRVGMRSPEEPEGLAGQSDIDVASPAELVEVLRRLL